MRRIATVVVLVVALFAAPVARVNIPNAGAATDWSGEYSGSFSPLEGLVFLGNRVEFVVDGYELRGGFILRIRSAPRVSTPRTTRPGGPGLGFDFGSADFDIDVCGVLQLPPVGRELRGIPVEGDEIAWSGPVTLEFGGGDPATVDCRTVATSQTRPAKLDVTVGSSGLRGSVDLEGFALPFTATRVRAATDAVTTTTLERLPEGYTSVRRRSVISLASRELGADTAEAVRRRLDHTTQFGDVDTEQIVTKFGGKDRDTAALAVVATMLGAARVTDANGDAVNAFPNVKALVRVFVKLAAHAVNAKSTPGDDGKAFRTLRRLLDLAIALDVGA
jgi:hypothetical protein